LLIHNRYRTTGGEERAVEDLMWLMGERLGHTVGLLTRDSSGLSRIRASAGLLAGGLEPDEVALAVRRTGARIVHAHNVHPSLGWRSLAAARDAGARVVLHLHNYRLVCAVGTCFTRGGDCTRCHGSNTVPGVALRCRGGAAEAVVYGAALAGWQRRLLAQADAVVVPSNFARERLRLLGVPLDPEHTHVIPPVVRQFANDSHAAAGDHVLIASRLAVEKGVEVAIDACREAGMALVVAGDGPLAGNLRLRARGGDVRFVGTVGAADLESLRRRAALALVPSLAAETFGLAAAEAMAAGVPVVASRVGALPELVEPAGLVAAGDAHALASAIRARRGDTRAGRRGLNAIRAVSAPENVAPRVAALHATLGEMGVARPRR